MGRHCEGKGLCSKVESKMTLKYKKIIAPVDRKLIEQELSEDRFIRSSNKGGNDLYIVNHHNSPNVMLEIGRLREISFRDSGGGTGEEVDIDEMDTCKNCYNQLIVYSAQDQEIIGGYRFIKCIDAYNGETDKYELSTEHYFDFSEKFKKEYLPKTLELGRSWVQPDYQPSNNPRKGVFALGSIWDGLGWLIANFSDMEYLFGKITMYPGYNPEARDLLLSFMHHYFEDSENLMTVKPGLKLEANSDLAKKEFGAMSFKEAYRALNKKIRSLGEKVPPLFNLYMHTSPTMKTFGTAINNDFGKVEETGILVTIGDIHQDTLNRHDAVKSKK